MSDNVRPIRPDVEVPTTDAATPPADGVTFSNQEIGLLCTALLKHAGTVVLPDRKGGAVLVVVALLRSAVSVATEHGFSTGALVRVLGSEFEAAEQILAAVRANGGAVPSSTPAPATDTVN